MTRDDSAGFAPPPAFGPFRVLHQIGVGVLGPVFRTYDARNDRLVAVKVFRLDVIPEQAQTLADRLQGLTALTGVDEAIVRPFGAGLEGTVTYLAEEYIAAESLDIALRHYAPAPVRRALTFIAPIARAIDAAAAQGFLHGGLHPRDIFVTPDRARVSGFGVAQALDVIGARAPVRRPYSAPERVAGGPWDVRADIYSLAAIAYELLTGRRVSGAGDPALLRSVKGAADVEALQAMFRRALDESLAERFGSAKELVTALGRTAVKDETVEAEEHELEEAPAPLLQFDTTAGGKDEPAGTSAPIRARKPGRRKQESPADITLDRGEGEVVDLPLADHALPPAWTAIEAAAPEQPLGVTEEEPAPFVAIEPAPDLTRREVAGAAGFAEHDQSAVEQQSSLDAAPPQVSETLASESPSGLPEELSVFGGIFSDEDEQVAPPRIAADATAAFAVEDEPHLDGEIPAAAPPPLSEVEAEAELETEPQTEPAREPQPALAQAQSVEVTAGFDTAPEDIVDAVIEPAEPEAEPELERMRSQPVAQAPRRPRSITPVPDVTIESTPEAEVAMPPASSRWQFSPVAFAATLLIGIAIGLGWGYWLGGGGSGGADTAESTVIVEDEGREARDTSRAATTGRTGEPAGTPATGRSSSTTAPGARVGGPGTAAGRPVGRLVLRSTPPGARVTINGMLRGSTPLELGGLPFGGYRIEMSRAGYRTETRRVTLSAAQSDVSADIRLSAGGSRPAPPAPAPTSAPVVARPLPDAPAPDTAPPTPRPAATTGSMVFDTRPRGARVLLDGRAVGVTPLELPDVTEGAHSVRFQLAGHKPWSVRTTVTAGRQTRVAASLER